MRLIDVVAALTFASLTPTAAHAASWKDLPGVKQVVAGQRAKARVKQEHLDGIHARGTKGARTIASLAETAAGTATWAPADQLHEATARVVDAHGQTLSSARASILAVRHELRGRLPAAERTRLTGVLEAATTAETALSDALARPSAPAPNLAKRGEPARYPGARPYVAPWRRPSPIRGQWHDPSPYGPWRAGGSYAREQIGRHVAQRRTKAVEEGYHTLAEVYDEMLAVGDSPLMYQTRSFGDVAVSDPHSIMNTEHIWSQKLVGDGIGSLMTVIKDGSAWAVRSDARGGSYAISIAPIMEGPDYRKTMVGWAATRKSARRLRDGREAIEIGKIEERPLPSGAHHIVETRTTYLRGPGTRTDRPNLNEVTETVRDEIAPRPGAITLGGAAR